MIKRSSDKQKRRVQESLGPWGNDTSSLYITQSPKKLRKGPPSAYLIHDLPRNNRESQLTLRPMNQRQSASSLIRIRYNSVLKESAMMQTLNLRKKVEPKQALQQLPILNFVIQGGDQQAQKCSRRDKFKSSFMVKHRLSLIRKEIVEKEEERKYKNVR